MRYSLLAPGKRLRPTMVLLAAEACGGELETALPAACAVEMVHAYSLVHDDLPAMDDDDLRRGRPTCHVKFGEALAILAGDALLTLAFEVLAREVKPEALAGRCCLELARAAGAAALVGGQADDLAAEESGGDLNSLEAIHRRKTGAMFLVSLRLGGLCAGADSEQLAALDAYGKAIGLAFQIVDDLLDESGDEAAVGKRLNKDADRGKLTFPRLLGVEESRRRAGVLVAEALAALRPFGPAAEGLEALARYVLERNR
jgi:geranylgeranyl diphosphate synthase type II